MSDKEIDTERRTSYLVRIPKYGESHNVGDGVAVHDNPVSIQVLPDGTYTVIRHPRKGEQS